MKLKTALLASLGVAASVVGASAVEEPPHQVVSRDGDFEIRDYPSMTVAETTVDAIRISLPMPAFACWPDISSAAMRKSKELT